jgi:hypothetical protein
MRLGFNVIRKVDFLEAYPPARAEAFKSQTIQNGFKATGIVPFQPDYVLQQLDIQLRTPTPPGSSSGSSTTSWVLQTPSNPRQLHQQAAKIKGLVEGQPQGLVEGLNQIIKACEYGMVSATIMKKQYQDIFNANETEKQKRTRSRARIQQQVGGLTSEEVQHILDSPAGAAEPAEAVEQLATQSGEPAASTPLARQRVPQRCSKCGIPGHKRTSCQAPIQN